jgi:hypothetical protein
MNDLSNEAVEIKDPHRLKRDLSRVLFPDDTPKALPSIEMAPVSPNKSDISAHLFCAVRSGIRATVSRCVV